MSESYERLNNIKASGLRLIDEMLKFLSQETYLETQKKFEKYFVGFDEAERLSIMLPVYGYCIGKEFYDLKVKKLGRELTDEEIEKERKELVEIIEKVSHVIASSWKTQ